MTELDLDRYIRILWKWLWLIVLSAGIAGAISFRVSKSLPPSYLTYTTLMVGNIATDPSVTNDQLVTDSRLADAYVDLARRQPILDAASTTLHLGVPWWQLQNEVVATRDGNQMITIRVVDTNPQRARAIADEIARQLIVQSPTAQNERSIAQRRQFVQQQLDSLQANIEQAQKTIADRQAQLDKATGARTVLDLQDQIKALNDKVAGWQTTYATLLTSKDTTPSNTLSVFEPAFVPTTPAGPNTRSNVMIAAGIGLVLALGAIFLIEYLDDTVGSPELVTRNLGLPILGSISSIGRVKNSPKGLITDRLPHSTITEAYRLLRTNIQLAYGDTFPELLLITSPGLHEGKSMTSANLAVTFARAGKRTILVDADLRHPSIHLFFGLPNDQGLTSLFSDGAMPVAVPQIGDQTNVTAELKRRVEASLVATQIPELRLLTTGPTLPINPAEILASPKMELLLKYLCSSADVIILDSPPVLPVADTTILAAKGASAILVVQAGKTRGAAARLALQNLGHAQARVLGLVLNKAPKAAPAYYAYRFHQNPPAHAPAEAPGSSSDASQSTG